LSLEFSETEAPEQNTTFKFITLAEEAVPALRVWTLEARGRGRRKKGNGAGTGTPSRWKEAERNGTCIRDIWFEKPSYVQGTKRGLTEKRGEEERRSCSRFFKNWAKVKERRREGTKERRKRPDARKRGRGGNMGFKEDGKQDKKAKKSTFDFGCN